MALALAYACCEKINAMGAPIVSAAPRKKFPSEYYYYYLFQLFEKLLLMLLRITKD